MRYVLLTIIASFCFTSCNQSRIEELESENERLQSELEDANAKIEEYESNFDEIKSLASDGYDAISYFNWSYQLQEALDAFDEIQSKADY